MNLWLRTFNWNRWVLGATWAACYLAIAVFFGWGRWKSTGAVAWKELSGASAGHSGLNLRLREAFGQAVLTISVKNLGATGTFAAQVYAMLGATVEGSTATFHPLNPRWRGTTDQKREIVGGQSQTLELLRVSHVKAAEPKAEGRFTVGPLTMLCADGVELELYPLWWVASRITEPITLFLRIADVATAAFREYEIQVDVVTDGHRAPRNSVSLRAR